MSIEALSWAMKQSVGDPVPKFILVIISDLYNDKFGYSFPSQEYIAERANCSIRTVQRHMDILIEGGFLAIEKKPNQVNKYTIPALENGCDNQTLNENGCDNQTDGHDNVVTRSLNTSYSVSILDTGINATKTYGDIVYQDDLKWLGNQDIGVKYVRPFIGKLRGIIKGKSRLTNEEVYKELHKLFEEVQLYPKGDLKSYLIKASEGIHDRLNKPKIKVLSEAQQSMIQSIVDQVYKKKNMPHFAGIDFHKLRTRCEEAMLNNKINDVMLEFDIK